MIPKYEQIKQALIKEIKNHQFMPGDKFYSESAIKQKFAVSSITAVKALNELTTAGYLYRIRGKGTFVSKAKVDATVKFSDIELHPVDQETTTVLSMTKANDPSILAELQLPKDAFYYEIVRLRSVKGEPFALNYTYLPDALVKKPLMKDITQYASVYERIRKDFNIDLFTTSSVETNEIIFPEKPDILNALNLSFREPVVKQIKHSYLPNQEVAEFIISYKHWRHFKTKIEVTGH